MSKHTMTKKKPHSSPKLSSDHAPTTSQQSTCAEVRKYDEYNNSGALSDQYIQTPQDSVMSLMVKNVAVSALHFLYDKS